MKAYVNTKAQRTDGTFDSYLSVSVDCIRKPLEHHKRGLMFTASGYGKRIPTEYMVKHNGKWKRVYTCCYSNTGTAYIGKWGDYNNTFATIDIAN